MHINRKIHRLTVNYELRRQRRTPAGLKERRKWDSYRRITLLRKGVLKLRWTSSNWNAPEDVRTRCAEPVYPLVEHKTPIAICCHGQFLKNQRPWIATSPPCLHVQAGTGDWATKLIVNAQTNLAARQGTVQVFDREVSGQKGNSYDDCARNSNMVDQQPACDSRGEYPGDDRTLNARAIAP